MAGFFDKFRKQKEQEVSEGKKAAKDTKDVKAAKASKAKKAKETKKQTSSIRPKGSMIEGLTDVIVRPHVTEKSAYLADAGQYVFVVSKNANRVQIAQAIKAMYGVQPIKVNVTNYKGKQVRFGRVRGRQNNWKKAVVSLPKGTKIDVYEGV